MIGFNGSVRTSARRWPCHPYPLHANAQCFVPLRKSTRRIWSLGVRRIRRGWHSLWSLSETRHFQRCHRLSVRGHRCRSWSWIVCQAIHHALAHLVVGEVKYINIVLLIIIIYGNIDVRHGFCYILIIHKWSYCNVLVISNCFLKVTNCLNC